MGITLREWDRLPIAERDLWLEADLRERTTCPDCGNPIAECSDPERVWYPYRRICYASMERASSKESYDAIHKDAEWHDGTFTSWAEKWSPRHPVPLNGDYIKIGVANHDLTPWDAFTTDPNASPLPPDESAGEGVESGGEHED